MVVHAECPQCHSPIEFDSLDAGRAGACPACGQPVDLPAMGIPIDEPAAPPIQPQVIYVQQPAPVQGHSVFYYSFWGTIGVVATLFILGFLFLLLVIGGPAFFSGFQNGMAKAEARQTNAATNQSR